MGACVGLAPMIYLLGNNADYDIDPLTKDVLNKLCIFDRQEVGEYDLNAEITSWLGYFQINGQFTAPMMNSGFEMAAKFANIAWILSNVEAESAAGPLCSDPGSDTQIPVLSRAGLVFLSLLLALYLLRLLSMAFYASTSPRWTRQLDSFTMMRYGAEMADQVPLMIGQNRGEIEVLDETSGFVGDMQPDAEIGVLGLGAPVGLVKKRRYRCYEGDVKSESRPQAWWAREMSTDPSTWPENNKAGMKGRTND